MIEYISEHIFQSSFWFHILDLPVPNLEPNSVVFTCCCRSFAFSFNVCCYIHESYEIFCILNKMKTILSCRKNLNLEWVKVNTIVRGAYVYCGLFCLFYSLSPEFILIKGCTIDILNDYLEEIRNDCVDGIDFTILFDIFGTKTFNNFFL